MANFSKKVKELVEKFEKDTLPKIEKRLDQAVKKVDDLTGKLGKKFSEAMMGRLPGPAPAQNVRDLFSETLRPVAPVEENFDPAAAAAEVLKKFKSKQFDEAQRDAETLKRKLDRRPAAAAAINMNPIIRHVTSLYAKKDAEAAARAGDWARSLVRRGADMSHVNAAAIRPLVEKQTRSGDFSAAKQTVQWARFVEKAANGQIAPEAKTGGWSFGFGGRKPKEGEPGAGPA
jgi:hypothetical protein